MTKKSYAEILDERTQRRSESTSTKSYVVILEVTIDVSRQADGYSPSDAATYVDAELRQAFLDVGDGDTVDQITAYEIAAVKS